MKFVCSLQDERTINRKFKQGTFKYLYVYLGMDFDIFFQYVAKFTILPKQGYILKMYFKNYPKIHYFIYKS